MTDDILDIEEFYDTRISNEALKKLAEKEEPRFLSILLRNKECLMDCVAFGIKSGPKGHFWNPKTRSLFNIILTYYNKYHTILTRTAIDSIMESIDSVSGKNISEEDKTNARMYWDAIWNVNCPVEDYELLRDNINNRYVQWQAYEILKDRLDGVVKSTGNQAKLVKNIQEDFYRIDNLDADPYSLTMDIKDGIPKVIKHIEERRDNPEDTKSILTGINGIDRIYHGFNIGSYTLISGQINGGKTTLMFNIGFNMAKAGYGVVYVSLEKEAIPFFTRLLALHALVDYNRIKVGGKGEYGLSDYYYTKLMEAANQLQTQIQPKLVCIQLAQGTKVSKVIAEIEKAKARMKIDVLIVDYLGVIGTETHHPGRPDLDEYNVSQRIQSFGRINRYVTITATQLKTTSSKDIRNKSKKATVDDASNVEINTEDMAGSKMIPADADNALGIAMNGDKPPTKCYVFGTKARDDEARNIITLDFDGKIGRISDPLLESGQVTEVDQILYNSSVSENDLTSDDGLFDEIDKATPTATTTTATTTTEVLDPEDIKEDPEDIKEDSQTVDDIFDGIG